MLRNVLSAEEKQRETMQGHWIDKTCKGKAQKSVDWNSKGTDVIRMKRDEIALTGLARAWNSPAVLWHGKAWQRH